MIYETSITNPKKQLEFYKGLSEQLQQENKELKQQLEEYIRAEMRLKAELEKQRKEYQEDYRFDELEKIENKMAFQKDLYYISFLLYLILFLILVLVVIFFVRKTKKIVKGRVIDNKNLEYFRDIPKKRTLREYASLSNYTGESYYTIATILELVNKKIIQMEAKKKEKKKLFEQVEYDYYLTISEGIQNQQLKNALI